MSYSCLINTAACLAVYLYVCVCVWGFRDVGQALRGTTQKSIIAPKHINAGGTNSCHNLRFLQDVFINSHMNRSDSLPLKLSVERGFIQYN